jgi:hypothetical protein
MKKRKRKEKETTRSREIKGKKDNVGEANHGVRLVAKEP